MKHVLATFAAAALVFVPAVRAGAAHDNVRAYVFSQPLRSCYPWLFAPHAEGAPVLNRVPRATPPSDMPNMEAAFNTFAGTHPLSTVKNGAPETDSAATYDPTSRTLLAALGWGEDSSTTMLVTGATAPYRALAQNDLSPFRVNGRLLLGARRATVERLYATHRPVSACGTTAEAFEQEGSGSRFAFVFDKGVVTGIFWFGL